MSKQYTWTVPTWLRLLIIGVAGYGIGTALAHFLHLAIAIYGAA